MTNNKNKDLSYLFPITSIELARAVSIKCTARDFEDIVYLRSGSNSNLFTVTYKGKKAAVKILKEKIKNPLLAQQEIVFEAGILARLNHPNIIKLFGAGEDEDERKFIVLEYLEGGTLSKLLKHRMNNPASVLKQTNNKNNLRLANTIPLRSIISIAKSVIQALKYLHHDFSENAVLIHRDLKPQNIGFTKEGQLKLFDFGLMACVKRRALSNEAYNMTGGTGTFFYMAPEVILHEAYTEMVDIYSFGVILWQMTSGMTPFVDTQQSDYMEKVVHQGYRPKVPDHLPTTLIQLIERCWDRDFQRRPNCMEVLDMLDQASKELISMPSLIFGRHIKRFFRTHSARVDSTTQEQNANTESKTNTSSVP
mmetsp:Transcript_22710/g.32615  ORF Transcript_22710/g.32615 Transcript_22710/m.32615 type:complete len:366 (-) Transcript_22710:1808-2905(-)|eukprot:CAMPEP_0170069444 /NCGR_PEP_ID=MMETSP0019_2-20121128/8119_1 /TAXON_ID=98059 /ORGANISM="Dinobryon sp., Strain UTEXLB2267" /LENGTH=365 /DNA_ID=CAMNT_0010277495 /DNA_START=149 /DNA_END=1246 /DNA_ORIENTATION=+